MQVEFTAPFLRQLRKLDPDLQEEVADKVELFEQNPDYPALKVHKLKGRLKGRWSLSVNYKTRTVFQYLEKEKVVLLAVGIHHVYNE